MNPVWKITLAEKGPLQPLILFLIAPDADSARVEIAKCFPSREIASVKPNADPFVRSEEIKEEYLNSGCEASDANEAVLRLMVECGELFEDNEAAYGFLMQGLHEEKENADECHAEDRAKKAYPNCEIVNATEIEADERSEA